MKRCFCYLLTLVLGSLAVGGLVFALLRTDVLTLTAATPTALFFFAATAAFHFAFQIGLTPLSVGKNYSPPYTCGLRMPMYGRLRYFSA